MNKLSILFLMLLAPAFMKAQVPSAIPLMLNGTEVTINRTTTTGGYPEYAGEHDGKQWSVNYNAGASQWELKGCEDGNCTVYSTSTLTTVANQPPYGTANWSVPTYGVASLSPFKLVGISKQYYGPNGYENISTSYICSGITNYVEFVAGPDFVTQNPFVTVQLSDANGNWDNLQVVGSIGAMAPPGPHPVFKRGTLNYISVPPGSGYKMRLYTYYNEDHYSNEIPLTPIAAATIAPVITGPTTSLCRSTTYTFTASDVSGATSYVWSAVNSGSPATDVTITGQGTSTAEISFGPGSNANAVRVYAVHPCGNTPYRSFNVYFHPDLPAITSITGTSDTPLAGSTQTYFYNFASYYGSIPDNTWSYSGTGVTFTPAGTNSVSAYFAPDATSGTLSVTATNGCGSSSGPATKEIVVKHPKTTAQNGPWHEPSTWTANEVPLVTDIVQVDHNVSVGAGAQCGSLTIGAAGKLTISDFDFTVGETQWDGTGLAPCGLYFLQIDGTLEITGGTLHVGGVMNKSGSGTFKMSNGLVRVKRGGCGGNYQLGALVSLDVNEGDVTGGTVEVLGNSGSYKGVSFRNFGPNSLIRIGKAGATSSFAGVNISPSFYYYFSMVFNRVGNVEINNLSNSSGPFKPMILSGGSVDLARINGNLTLTGSNTILVGEETYTPTPTTMGLVVKGNFINNTNTLQMASGRVLFFGGEGAYSVSTQQPYCTSWMAANQTIGGSGTVTGITCNCNNGNIVLASPVTMNDFTLGGGNVELGDYNLNILRLRTTVPPSGYFVTNGTGKLTLKYGYISGESVINQLFPVGTAGRYTPVNIRLQYTADAEISVGVKNTFTHTPLTSKNVGVEWNISSTTSTPANVTFTWNETDESAGFNRDNLTIARYNGTAWETKASGLSASGAGPYSAYITDITQFSPWAIFDTEGALPVRLSDFTVSPGEIAGTALLQWATTSETNASHFDIERSPDAKAWQKIGEVKANGESTGLTNYHHIATSTNQHISYYRLRMTDFDGTFTYSPIRSLVPDASARAPRVYPNPASDRLRLNLPNTGETASVTIISLAGRELPAKLLNELEGPSLDVSHLPAGIYLVRINSKNSPTETHRVVISR